MHAKSVLALGGLSAALLSLTSCIVGVGDWERYNKDFHLSYPLKPGGKLSVETFNGSIDISGWDQDTVDITGTKYGPTQEEADNLKVNVDSTADSVSIRVPRPTDRRNNQGARMTIKVPRKTQLDHIVTSNSSIQTDDGAGALDIGGALLGLSGGDVVDRRTVHQMVDPAQLGDGLVGQLQLWQVADQGFGPFAPLGGEAFEPS